MLTDIDIKRALKMGKDTQLSDGNARGTGRLIVRIKAGKADWYAQQWVNDKRRLSHIGAYPQISLAEARKTFEESYRPKIVNGEAIRVKTGTVAELFADYVSHLREREKRSAEDFEKTLNRMAALIGPDKRAGDVTAKDIVEAIRPTYEAGKPSMADHMRGYVHSAYGWALRTQNDYRSKRFDKFGIKTNPASNIPTEPKVPGERWLPMSELIQFWKWLENGGTKHMNRNTDPRNYLAVQLLIMTGQRSEEIARIQSSMLNADLRVIDWPKTKNGRAHVLPLDDRLWNFVKAIKPNEHGLLFPSEVFPDRCITDQTMRMVTVRYILETKSRHFTPRDLRRSWKTNAGIAKLSKEIRDKLQNHAQRDVSSVHYDRYDYLDEKREAMVKWMDWFSVKIKSPQ